MRLLQLTLRRLLSLGSGADERSTGFGGAASFEASRPLFELEVRRARRYERPFGILLLKMETFLQAHRNGIRDARRAQPQGRPHSGVAASPALEDVGDLHLGTLLREVLRESDLIARGPDRQEFVALLPEVERATGELIAARAMQLVMARHGAGSRVGLAVFPADGFALADLIAFARADLRNPLIPARTPALNTDASDV